jgi:hypothetical protein
MNYDPHMGHTATMHDVDHEVKICKTKSNLQFRQSQLTAKKLQMVKDGQKITSSRSSAMRFTIRRKFKAA